jgi:hypothetical protein
MTEPPFVLTQSERTSPLWGRLEEHLNKRLEAKRRQNDARVPQPDTDFLRGEIAQLKAFLALGKPSAGS